MARRRGGRKVSRLTVRDAADCGLARWEAELVFELDQGLTVGYRRLLSTATCDGPFHPNGRAPGAGRLRATMRAGRVSQ